MKKVSLLLCFLVFVFGFDSVARASMFRVANVATLSKAARTKGSVALKGVVQKIENKDGYLLVTFNVNDVLRGNAKVGESLVFKFPEKATRLLRLGLRIDPPQLSEKEEVVLFVTQNIGGEHFLIGGEQSLFRVKTVNGQSVVSNSLKNANLTNGLKPTDLNRQIQREIVQKKDGGIAYESFKQLLNESDS